MKKVLGISAAIFFTLNIYSQSIEKGDFLIKAGVGFGVYSLSSNDYEESSNAGVPGLIPLSLTYHVSEKFGLGLEYERNGFVTDSSHKKAISHNFGVKASYNFVNSEKNTLSAFFYLGSSSFRFDNFDDRDYITGSGSLVQFGSEWNHFFGEKIGMFINFSIPYFSYNTFKYSKRRNC